MLASIDPSTGQNIASYPAQSASKITAALEKADRAFQKWKRLGFSPRAKHFIEAAEILKKNKDRYARLMALEMGKPLEQGRSEIEKCAWVCEFYAKEAEVYLRPEPAATDAQKSYVAFEPLGVIYAVMPWNFPFWQVFRFAVPSLMAGNTTVLKHAPNVTGCALEIEKIFEEAGFPEGVFTPIFVAPKDVDKITTKLIADPRVRAVTLTGSVRAGRSVAEKAGAALKKCVLELGGSDAYVILEDADLDEAAVTCASSRILNGGQSCVAAKRFVVVKGVAEKFTQKLLERMKEQEIGPPLESSTTVGPMARVDLRDELHRQVQASVRKGAKCVLGGVLPNRPGAFYPPTVLVNVKKGMPAYSEELFGPVASIIEVKDEAAALRVANDTEFGLGSAVFTRDLARGEKIAADDLEAGMAYVNASVKSDPRLPFGGIKHSGYGRELGSFGIREFVNVKTVYVAKPSK